MWHRSTNIISQFYQDLLDLTPQLVSVAQMSYNDWDKKTRNGMYQNINESISQIVAENISDVDFIDNIDESNPSIIAYNHDEAYEIKIPIHTKISNHTGWMREASSITTEDVLITPIDREDIDFLIDRED